MQREIRQITPPASVLNRGFTQYKVNVSRENYKSD